MIARRRRDARRAVRGRRGSSSVAPVDLDGWLAEPTVRIRQRRESPTLEAELWACAQTVRLRDCRVLGRLIRARIPGLQASLTFNELFRHDPFNRLETGPTHALSGLCGRIWTVRGDFAVLSDPAEFRVWEVPGTVRVLFASWTEPTAKGAALVSEVRIGAVDGRAARYVRALEPFIGAFQGLVGVEPLSIAARRAARRTGR
jgi:hypothetical protein